jgi:hypothetical protein
MYFSYDSKYLFLLLTDSNNDDRIKEFLSFDLETLKETSDPIKFDFKSLTLKGKIILN